MVLGSLLGFAGVALFGHVDGSLLAFAGVALLEHIGGNIGGTR